MATDHGESLKIKAAFESTLVPFILSGNREFALQQQ